MDARGLQILLQIILASQETTARQKERFLAENRKALTIASGGRVTRTDGSCEVGADIRRVIDSYISTSNGICKSIKRNNSVVHWHCYRWDHSDDHPKIGETLTVCPSGSEKNTFILQTPPHPPAQDF